MELDDTASPPTMPEMKAWFSTDGKPPGHESLEETAGVKPVASGRQATAAAQKAVPFNTVLVQLQLTQAAIGTARTLAGNGHSK